MFIFKYLIFFTIYFLCDATVRNVNNGNYNDLNALTVKFGEDGNYNNTGNITIVNDGKNLELDISSHGSIVLNG